MRAKRKRLSQKQFNKRHPDVDIGVVTLANDNDGEIRRFAYLNGRLIASAAGSDDEEVLAILSDRLLRVKGRMVAEAQGFRDANTGEHAPLQAHHRQKRSRGRLDALENLSGTSPQTHTKLHESK